MAQPNSPTWVGEQFISKYYDVLEKLPRYLNRFYKENSTFSVTDVQPDGSAVVEAASGNLEAIEDKVMGTIANAVVASDKILDAQFSQGEGVLLQVSGTMNIQGVDRKFVQAFFLATQEKGYYVLNDILRIFPPEPVRDMRPLENGLVAPQVPAIPPPAFEFAPPQLQPAGQMAPRVDIWPGMPPVAPSAVVVLPVAAEAEVVVQEQPAAAPAPVPAPPPAPAAVLAPAAPVPAPAPVAPVAAPVPVPAPVPAAPAPTKQAAPQQAPPAAPAASSTAAAPAMTPQNLSWAERAKLATSAPPAPAPGSKPVTPAKAPQPAVPASAPEMPAADVGVLSPAPVVSEAEAPAEAPGDAESEDKIPEVLESVAGGAENDPGFGVYVQGVPQHLAPNDLKKLLSGEFAQFGAFGPGGVNVVRSPRFGMVAYVFYLDEKSRDAAREASGKLRLAEGDKPVKILGALPEFERGFAPRGGGRGDRGRGSGMSYRGGRGGFDGGRGRAGRGEGGRGDRPMGGHGGRGGERGGRGGRGGGPGRGPRDPSNGTAVPKQAA